MNDIDKTKEELVAEIAGLRREIEELREREKSLSSPPDATKDLRAVLVNEVPEYLYSIESANGKVIATFHSPQCQEITGYSPTDYQNNPTLWISMIHEQDRDKVLDFIRELRVPLHCKSIEHRIIRKDGSVGWVLNMSTVHTDGNPEIQRQSGFLIDVTERMQQSERTSRLLDETRRDSFTDDLTQLFNRRAFRVLAEQQIHVAGRIDTPVVLFFIDVDRLKYVNDTFGHVAGDGLLMNLATILKSTFRESDIIARIGGDEFAVLSMETGPEFCGQQLARLKANIDAKNREENRVGFMSVSMGVSRCGAEGEVDSISNLLDRADKDMYQKKRSKAVSEVMELAAAA